MSLKFNKCYLCEESIPNTIRMIAVVLEDDTIRYICPACDEFINKHELI